MYDPVIEGFRGAWVADPPPAVVVVCAELVMVRSSSTEMLESEKNNAREVFTKVLIIAP
jgi:hypothetical protein